MKDKHIFIAGATSGIGRKVAESCLRKGAIIYGMGRSQSSDLPFERFWQVDVKETSELTALPESLDGFVYCPGSINLKAFRSLTDLDFIDDFSINVLGAVRLLRLLEKPLKAARGSVVLYSTVAVGRGMPFHSSVAASKAALEGLTRSLAAEWAPRIRINCIAPSLTDTPLANKLINTEEKQEKSAQRHPLKRYGTPADIASLTHFLLSEQSTWITGQVWGVDGGLSVI